jgi:hypothetical protein
VVETGAHDTEPSADETGRIGGDTLVAADHPAWPTSLPSNDLT